MTLRIKDEIEKLDLRTASTEAIRKIISSHFQGHIRPSLKISPDGLFRARIVTGKPLSELETTKCIWYPDYSEIDSSRHRYNRCSDIGENFFYSSNYLGATIKELSPENNDLVLIGMFYRKNENVKFKTMLAGIEALARNPEYKSLLGNYSYPEERAKHLEKLMSDNFQKRIAIKESYKYKLSIAFSKNLLHNSDTSCIIYPSVATELEYINIGIKPSFVDEHLICICSYFFSLNTIKLIQIIILFLFSKFFILSKSEIKFCISSPTFFSNTLA